MLVFACPSCGGKLQMPENLAGTSNTFMYADAASDAMWARPLDMPIQPGQSLPLPPDRFFVCFADGSVRQIDRRKVSDATLRLLIDPADGNVLPQLD
jgi:hypothetical protein